MMIRLWKKAREVGQFLRSRAFAVSMLSLVLACVVFRITSTMNAVSVIGDYGRTLSFTMESNPQELAERYASGESGAEGAIVSEVEGHYAEIDTQTLRTATITVDGATTSYQVENGTTVGDLLYQNGITYDGNDLLTPSSEKTISDGDEIVLKRVEYEEHIEQEAIPFTTVHKNSPLVRVGTSKCIQPGADGIRTLTYTRRTVDGVQEDEHLLGEKISQQPVKETVLIGSVAPVSDLDFDLNVDEHGKPVKYARLLKDQVATGYSARQGARTASGRYAITGHVAVNPNEIPYGSKLYIVSKDNRFVYGCAIAADTGTGLMADIVDVDLFYDTYAESAMNGRKIVDIYVLE